MRRFFKIGSLAKRRGHYTIPQGEGQLGVIRACLAKHCILGDNLARNIAKSLNRLEKGASLSRAPSRARAFPRVVPANKATAVTILPAEGDAPFRDAQEYLVSHYPAEEISLGGCWYPDEGQRVRAEKGALHLEILFAGEQEHILWIEEECGGERQPVAEARVYSLAPDLFALRPYKGDLHIHSNRSDGREPPAYVAAACRKIGMDFLAITDHRLYEPSLEAIRAFEGVPTDLLLVPGEEVHPPNNPVHIINFGGRFSLNALFDTESYREGVERYLASLNGLPEGVDPYQAASCLWCFDMIRQAEGLGIFCHPYWFTHHRYTPSGALTTYLFEKQPFDAFEVIGGFFRHEVDSNTLQVARYHEEQKNGKRIPIVGVSDAHGCHTGELFGWYYTIAWAPTLTFEAITDAIKSLRSVAVEAVAGETPRAYGPFRLVKYALYLMREVFPEHDALCAREGDLMLRYLEGDKAAFDDLHSLQGGVARLYDRLWAAAARPNDL